MEFVTYALSPNKITDKIIPNTNIPEFVTYALSSNKITDKIIPDTNLSKDFLRYFK